MQKTARLDASSLPLAALGTLVLVTLLAVTAARWSGLSAQQLPDASSVSVRLLSFEDLRNGGIAVHDAQTGAVLSEVAPGTNGFLRSTMRGLARERHRRGLGADQPFELHARADGRLTLIDPATQRRVDLESFGSTNMAVFAQLLAAAPRSETP